MISVAIPQWIALCFLVTMAGTFDAGTPPHFPEHRLAASKQQLGGLGPGQLSRSVNNYF